MGVNGSASQYIETGFITTSAAPSGLRAFDENVKCAYCDGAQGETRGQVTPVGQNLGGHP